MLEGWSEALTGITAFFSAIAAIAALWAALSARRTTQAELQVDVRVTLQDETAPFLRGTKYRDPNNLFLRIENVGRSMLYVRGICRCWYVSNIRGELPFIIEPGRPPDDHENDPPRFYKKNNLPIGPGSFTEIQARPMLLHPKQREREIPEKGGVGVGDLIKQGSYSYCYGYVEIENLTKKRFYRGFCLSDIGNGVGYIDAWPDKDTDRFHYIRPEPKLSSRFWIGFTILTLSIPLHLYLTVEASFLW